MVPRSFLPQMTTKSLFMIVKEEHKKERSIPENMASIWYISRKIKPMWFMPQPKKMTSLDTWTFKRTSTSNTSGDTAKELLPYAWIPPTTHFFQAPLTKVFDSGISGKIFWRIFVLQMILNLRHVPILLKFRQLVLVYPVLSSLSVPFSWSSQRLDLYLF